MINQLQHTRSSSKMLLRVMRNFKTRVVIALAILLFFSSLLFINHSDANYSPLLPTYCSINSTQIHSKSALNSCLQPPVKKSNLIDILGHSLLNAWYRVRY